MGRTILLFPPLALFFIRAIRYLDERPVLGRLVALAVGLILGGILLWLAWGLLTFNRRAERSLRKICEEARSEPGPEDGPEVEIDFPTFYGFIVYSFHQRHRLRLPYRKARRMLWRLHWFNMRWSLLAHGSLLLYPYSLMRYVLQRRSIRKQLEKTTEVGGK
jgi:hypothetical protein